MRIKHFLAGIASLALVAAPTVAAANPAQSLSVAPTARASADTGDSAQLAGGGGLIAVLALAAVFVGVILITNSDDDPDSP